MEKGKVDIFKKATERSEPIREVLRRNDRLFTWGLEAAPDLRVEVYTNRGLGPVVLLLHQDGGFNTFVEASPNSNKIDDDVKALDSYLNPIRDIDKPKPSLREVARRFPSLTSKIDAIPPVSEFASVYSDNSRISNALFEAYDPEKNITHAGWVTGGSKHAIAFILNIWSASSPFNLAAAMNVWDSAHRAAFKAWLNDGGFTY